MNSQKSVYDPFVRGPYAVGVITQNLHDDARNRTLPTEIWYPAEDKYKGMDLDEETNDKYEVLDIATDQKAVRDAKFRKDTYPLIVYSHGNGGNRRMSNHLCTHLSSHGYIVAAPDHLGNTTEDMAAYAAAAQKGEPPDLVAIGTEVFINRPIDIRFTVDCLLSGKVEVLTDFIVSENVGLTGYSYGGWTVLMNIVNDNRVKAVLPIASSGGSIPGSTEPNPLKDYLNLSWERDVNVLLLASDKDSLVPLESIRDIFDKISGNKRMVVLNNADHIHYCTDIVGSHEMIRNQPEFFFGESPITENIRKNMQPLSALCSPESAHTFLQGLGVAHMDAYLKHNGDAINLFSGDISALMKEKGIDVTDNE